MAASIETGPNQPRSDRLMSRPTLRYHPLVLVLAAVCAGVLFDRLQPVAVGGWIALATLLWVIWLAAWRRDRPRFASAALLSSLACLAGAWHHLNWSSFAADELALAALEHPSPVAVELVAQQAPRYVRPGKSNPLEPVQRGVQSRFMARVVAVRDQQSWRRASGQIRVRVDGQVLGVRAGDRLRVAGQLSAPTPPMNPGEFDFAANQRADRVLAHLWIDHPAGVRVVGRHWPAGFFGWFDGCRLRAQRALHAHLGGDARDLADALILGQREQLTYEQNDAYFRTGMIHLLSISGVHVGVLALGLLWSLRLGVLRRTTALLGVAGLTISYALLIDAEPPAVRATILVVLACGSLLLGRDTRPFNVLAAAALIVLAMNPADLFRAGPQLSFLAAAVLAYLARHELQRAERDPLDTLIAATRPWPIRAARRAGRLLVEAMLVSLAIWLVSMPLVATQFHIATPIALLLTPLLGIPVAISLFSGFGVLLADFLFPPLAPLAAWCFEASVAMIDGGIQWGLAIPGNHAWLPSLAAWAVAAFYLILLLTLLAPAWQARPRREFATVAVASFLTLIAPREFFKSGAGDELRCTFLAVGHGCSVLIELPDGKQLLYDAGHLGPPIYAAQSISGALFSRQIRQLDALVISHADIDHYNAVPELLNRLAVKQAWLTERFRADRSAATAVLLQSLAEHRIPNANLANGDRLWIDPRCSIRVLHPPAEGVAGSDNANSIVLLVEYLGRRILLTGDLESPGLERLIHGPPLDVDVLLAPHHGSTRSNPPGCATWCTPEWVVISGGHEAQPAVRTAYENAGATVLHTAEVGAVTFHVNAAGVKVETFRGGRGIDK